MRFKGDLTRPGKLSRLGPWSAAGYGNRDN